MKCICALGKYFMVKELNFDYVIPKSTEFD